MTRVLDRWISRMASRLDGLSRDRFGLFFAYVAERLLPLYEHFERKHHWGDSGALRDALDRVWDWLSGIPVTPVAHSLSDMNALSPSGEMFDSPDSTYAQDAVINVDAAVRAATADVELDGRWVEYALEPVRTKVSIEQSGFAVVEGQAAADWEARLMENPEVAEFIQDLEHIMTRVEGSSAPTIAGPLRQEARQKALRAEQYIIQR